MRAGAKFALFHHGALGDFVLLFPILRSLASHRVALVAASSRGQLAAGLFDHVRAVNGDQPHLIRLFGPGTAAGDPAAIARDLDRPGWIISFVSCRDDPWTRRVAETVPGAQIACVEPRPPDTWTGHVADWHRHRLREAGLDLPPVPAARRAPRTTAGPVLVHVGSGGRMKCWPPQRWFALIAALRARGCPVEVIYGEAERERWTVSQRDAWHGEGAAFVEGLESLRARIARCGTFVGHDAGPTHLAAQLAARTIALFGPTVPRRWAPLGPDVQVLAPEQPAPMTWLSEGAVVRAVCGT